MKQGRGMPGNQKGHIQDIDRRHILVNEEKKHVNICLKLNKEEN
jgi:hypothetical protein